MPFHRFGGIPMGWMIAGAALAVLMTYLGIGAVTYRVAARYDPPPESARTSELCFRGLGWPAFLLLEALIAAAYWFLRGYARLARAGAIMPFAEFRKKAYAS